MNKTQKNIAKRLLKFCKNGKVEDVKIIFSQTGKKKIEKATLELAKTKTGDVRVLFFNFSIDSFTFGSSVSYWFQPECENSC